MSGPDTAPEPRQRYREAVAALAEPLHRRIAGLDEADRALAAGLRAATELTAAAHRAAREADAEAARARAGAEQADRDASRIWRDVRSFHGRRGHTLGDLPEPLPVDTAHPASAPALLARAERMLAQARRGELRVDPPVPVWPVMLAAGVLGALVLAGVGRAVLSATGGMTGDSRTALKVIAEIAFFAAPFAGIPLGAWWLSRYGQPMTLRWLAWAFGSGLVVGCSLLALLA